MAAASTAAGAASRDVRRTLHWVMKVGNLKRSLDFFTEVFGMRVLRHEEFDSGCEATCNGPYGGAWSKTMIGYAPETENFALELTYNYGVESYEKADDLRYICIRANKGAAPWQPFNYDRMLAAALRLGYEADAAAAGGAVITGPDDIKYKLVETDRRDPFAMVSVHVSDLQRSLAFWRDHLGMTDVATAPGAVGGDNSAVLQFSDAAAKLELVQNSGAAGAVPVEHGTAFGRIAFTTREGPRAIFDRIKAVDFVGGGVTHEPVTLPTPGKADVDVVILTDPDAYEICFVNEAGFDDLCTTKPGDDFVDWQLRAQKGGDGHALRIRDLLGEVDKKDVEELGADEEFQEKVRAAEGTVVVMWGAKWCKFCAKALPTFAEFSQTWRDADGNKVPLFKADKEVLTVTAAEEAVTQIPHFQVWRNGAKLGELKDSQRETITALLAEHVGGAAQQ